MMPALANPALPNHHKPQQHHTSPDVSPSLAVHGRSVGSEKGAADETERPPRDSSRRSDDTERQPRNRSSSSSSQPAEASALRCQQQTAPAPRQRHTRHTVISLDGGLGGGSQAGGGIMLSPAHATPSTLALATGRTWFPFQYLVLVSVLAGELRADMWRPETCWGIWNGTGVMGQEEDQGQTWVQGAVEVGVDFVQVHARVEQRVLFGPGRIPGVRVRV
eukprot:2232100-Rhodomonas_salina.4